MPGGFTVWLTGLPGAGKSTLAGTLRQELVSRGYAVEILDGDVVRSRLSPDLTFSKADRDVNVRRTGYMAHLLSSNGVVVIAALVSPYREARDDVRRLHVAPFIEVYVECPIDALIRRDPKGLYAKAIRGEVLHFTGISDPYEAPLAPDITVRTDIAPPTQSLYQILQGLEDRGMVRRRASFRAGG